VSPGLSLSLTVLLPLAAVPFIALLHARPNAREAVSLIAATLLFATVWPLSQAALAGTPVEVHWAEPIQGLAFALSVEPLGALFALLASSLWIVTTLYSIGYMRGHHELHQTRFYIWFAVAIASAMGIAFAANLLTLFIFYEALTLSTFPLVTHSGTDEAKRAGRLYLGILVGASIALLLLAVIWTWSLAGTLDFTPGGILEGRAPPYIVHVLLALYVFGIAKAAVMPFHRWLPAAMVAPTPVSALLHAVAVVKAGVFTILKVVVYVFGTDFIAQVGGNLWLAYVAAATILIAAIIAMTRDNLKARLAYSTISQLSYIVLGALLLNRSAIIGASLQILMHGFAKITLFFCAGAILVASHKTRVSELAGIGRRQPITIGAFFVASVSIIGLPPTGGGWSKWFLALGTVEADQMILLGVLMLSSLLSIGYLMPVFVRAFFAPPPDDAPSGMNEAPVPALIALCLTAAGCILLFFFPDPFYRLAERIPGP
jgi:multicomponent Na+:H+ antiporter subunit D